MERKQLEACSKRKPTRKRDPWCGKQGGFLETALATVVLLAIVNTASTKPKPRAWMKETKYQDNTRVGLPIAQRLNSTELFHYILEKFRTIPVFHRHNWTFAIQRNVSLQHKDKSQAVYDELPYLLPLPDVSGDRYTDPVHVFQPEALERLRNLFFRRDEQNRNSSKNLVICFDGGSSTAGAALNQHDQMYGHVMADQLQKRFLNMNNITVVNRGHGGREGFYSGLLMHSFVPYDVDVLVWEYSINDQDFAFSRPSQNNETRFMEARNMFIRWLQQVERIRNGSPPLVILAYIWDKPFRYDEHQRVNQYIFNAHQQLASEYKFVVGYINLANYVSNLQWPWEHAYQLFLHDNWHPSPFGHAVMGFLLLNLIASFKENFLALGTDLKLPTTNTRTKLGYSCGASNHDALLVHNMLLEKFPFASYSNCNPSNVDNQDTFESNNGQNPGMLQLLSQDTVLGRHGGQPRPRIDNLRSYILPCCPNNSKNKTLITASVAASPDKWLSFGMPKGEITNLVSGLYVELSLHTQWNNVTVLLEDDTTPSPRLLITDTNNSVYTRVSANETWKCLLGGRPNSGQGYYTNNWLVLHCGYNVSKIHFCDHRPDCLFVKGTKDQIGLISVALF